MVSFVVFFISYPFRYRCAFKTGHSSSLSCDILRCPKRIPQDPSRRTRESSFLTTSSPGPWFGCAMDPVLRFRIFLIAAPTRAVRQVSVPVALLTALLSVTFDCLNDVLLSPGRTIADSLLCFPTDYTCILHWTGFMELVVSRVCHRCFNIPSSCYIRTLCGVHLPCDWLLLESVPDIPSQGG